MRWTGIAGIVALFAGIVVAGLAPAADAQGRAARGGAVGAPSGGQLVRRVTPTAPSTGGGAVSVPSGGQEVLIVTPGGSSTRVTIERLPGPAGVSGGPPTQGAASVPSFSRETHVTIERDGTRQEFQIFSNGPEVQTPIVIFPD